MDLLQKTYYVQIGANRIYGNTCTLVWVTTARRGAVKLNLLFHQTRVLKYNIQWPFGNLTYANMMETMDRFDTNDQRDLVDVYEQLIGKENVAPSRTAASL